MHLHQSPGREAAAAAAVAVAVAAQDESLPLGSALSPSLSLARPFFPPVPLRPLLRSVRTSKGRAAASAPQRRSGEGGGPQTARSSEGGRPPRDGRLASLERRRLRRGAARDLLEQSEAARARARAWGNGALAGARTTAVAVAAAASCSSVSMTRRPLVPCRIFTVVD